MTDWYYVDQEKNDRIGPISEAKLTDLIQKKVLIEDSYVWKRGLENWKLIKEIPELASKLIVNQGHASPAEIALPPRQMVEDLDWGQLDHSKRQFLIKIGRDRGQDYEVEYGPYTFEELKQIYTEKRINPSTLYYAFGMNNWRHLGDIPNFKVLFNTTSESVVERRNHIRKPFIARVFFHNESSLFEGVCRDISTGGLQILTPFFPGKLGDEIQLNVHPDNSDFCFVAQALVARILEGNIGVSVRFIHLSPNAVSAIENYLATSG